MNEQQIDEIIALADYQGMVLLRRDGSIEEDVNIYLRVKEIVAKSRITGAPNG